MTQVLTLTVICLVLLVRSHLAEDNHIDIDDLEAYDDDFRDLLHKHHDWGGDTEDKIEKEEEIFFFFEDHDEDMSRSLDGVELLQAMYHADVIDLPALPQEAHDHAHHAAVEKWRINRMAALVDKSLNNFDGDDDGYLSWPEFYKAALQYNLVAE